MAGKLNKPATAYLPRKDQQPVHWRKSEYILENAKYNYYYFGMSGLSEGGLRKQGALSGPAGSFDNYWKEGNRL